MQIRMTGRRLALATTAGMLATAIPSHAQFGGVVFDPTQSAHAVVQIQKEEQSLIYQTQQIAQGSESNMTLGQQLVTDLKLAQTALQTYTTVMNTYQTMLANLQHFSAKNIWRTAENALLHAQVGNQYGETSGLQATLNGSPGMASDVWKIMNVAVNGSNPSFWGGQVTGASDRLTALASIETLDAVSTQCLSAAGSYSAGRTTNLPAQNALQTTTFDGTPATNSELEQFNLLNMGSSQQTVETRNQGQLQACMAAQAAASNMAARNIASLSINDAAYKMSQQQVNPTYAGNESNTWTTYF